MSSWQNFFSLITYGAFRFFGFLISQLSYPAIHKVGNGVGSAIYYLHRNFRKKTLSNLAIAFGKTLKEEERKKIARASFQNLTITCLELFRLKKSKGKLSEIVTFEENPKVRALVEKKQGVIFLIGHQANWEIPFIAMTEKYPGVGIGRPIKNMRIYNWILSVRQMHGGTIVLPRNAIKVGLKNLQQGKFLGIVGDQAFPESNYSYPLFGTRAWTMATPAVIAYRTKSPLVPATIQRIGQHYIVKASDPIWPNLEEPKEKEIPRMMNHGMAIIEKSILEKPEQWLWQHDRWKQQGIDHVKRKYRFGFVLIILPKDCSSFESLLPLFRKIFPDSFLSFFAPEGTSFTLNDAEWLYYKEEKDLFIRDYRYQLVLDFYDSASLRRHFRKLGAFQTLSLKKMKKISGIHDNLERIIAASLVKSECLSNVIT